MPTKYFVTDLFSCVDDKMLDVKKHPQAAHNPSEVVILTLLFVLEGQCNRAIYCWL